MLCNEMEHFVHVANIYNMNVSHMHKLRVSPFKRISIAKIFRIKSKQVSNCVSQCHWLLVGNQ